MPTALVGIEDARARVAIWNALVLAVADAQLDPALAVDIVTTGLPAETDDAVITAFGRWVTRTLAGTCLEPAARPGALARIAGAMLAVTDVAEAGSGRQLAAARLAVATTTEVPRLRGWLAGAQVPTGLAVDPELRWAILLRLVGLGEAGEDAIAAEAERDRTSEGAVHAARCRAAAPDRRAKRAAWNAIMRDTRRANYELYAVAEGFWDPDQRELTDRYVERYFEQIADTAQLRSGWAGSRIAALAYPWTAVAESTLSATERLLADAALDPGIGRSVSDAADDLRRAVAVRARAGTWKS
jgi:aminopeptidase N